MQRIIFWLLAWVGFPAFLILPLGQASLLAEDPAQIEVRRAEVRKLVRRLDGTELADRDAAEAELFQRGPAILDLLPPVTERTSAEVSQRLGRVRQKLQLARAETATETSAITLQSDAISFSDALAALQTQSGNVIIDHRQAFSQPITNPTLNADFNKTPFWKALDQLLDQAKLTVYPYSDDRTIRIMAGSGDTHASRTSRACYSGPFRFEPVRVLASRDLRDRAGTSLHVVIEVAWEPRLQVISLRQRMTRVEAVDERGVSIPIDDAEAQLEVPIRGNATAVELSLPFQLPPRETKRIASLRGTLTAVTPGKMETFRFGKLPNAKNVEQRIAGATVTLDEVRKNAAGWDVLMRVRFDDAGDALASHYTWIFHNEATLETPDGKSISYASYETTLQKKNEVGISYSFALEKPMDAMSFVYKTPGTIVTKEIAFDLRDIELP